MTKRPFVMFVAGLLSSVVVGQSALWLTRETPRGTQLQLVNAELVFNVLPDGGTATSFRACGYEHQLNVDGGPGRRLGEPCWSGSATPSAAAPLIRDLLDKGVPLFQP